MATIVENVRIELDTEEAKRRSKEFNDGMTGSFIKAQVAVAALSKALDFMTDQFKAGLTDALEFEKTTIQINTTLARLGDTTGAWGRAMELSAGQLQQVTGISDEVIRSMQQQALNMGVSTDRVEDLIKASISLSNTMGVDVNSAFRQLVKTTSGAAGELGEILPAVSSLTKEQRQAGAAIDLVNESMGDQLGLMTQGVGGAGVSIANSWADLREEFVKFSIDALAIPEIMSRISNGLTMVRRGIEKDRGVFDIIADVGEALVGTNEDVVESYKEIEKSAAKAAMEVAKTTVGALRKVKRAEAGGGFDFDKTGRETDTGIVVMAGRVMTTEQANKFEKDSITRTERLNAVIDRSFAEGTRRYLAGLEDTERKAKESAERVATSREAIEGAAVQSFQVAGSMMAQTMTALMTGQKVALDQLAANMLFAIGQTLVQKGFADAAMAAADAFILGRQATAGPLAAAAAVEIATGTTMMGLGRAAGAGRSPRSVSSIAGRGAGGGAGSFGAGGGFGSAPSAGSAEPRTIVINVTGAISQADAGREIRNALAAAQAEGL